MACPAVSSRCCFRVLLVSLEGHVRSRSHLVAGVRTGRHRQAVQRSAARQPLRKLFHTGDSKVLALEAATSALGTTDAVAWRSRQEALLKANQEASSAPVGERLDSCSQFLERAWKLLARADEELVRIQSERTQIAVELEEGQAVSKSCGRTRWLRRSQQPQKLVGELQRVRGVIDELLRARAQLPGTAVPNSGGGFAAVGVSGKSDDRPDTRSSRMNALDEADAHAKRARLGSPVVAEGKSRRVVSESERRAIQAPLLSCVFVVPGLAVTPLR